MKSDYFCFISACMETRNAEDLWCTRMRQREISRSLRPISLFAVPKSDHRLEVWKNALKYDLIKTQHICQLHFADKYIRKSETIKLFDDTISCVSRDHWSLETEAVRMLLVQPTERSEHFRTTTFLSRIVSWSTTA
ncbi:uncharacterized protein [Neodiprion pinetum]|uniref:uncharacterized protein isoform X2 n=1 Tax=Neodiprion pinetum TaxID=441929 RepID=UPI0037150E8A